MDEKLQKVLARQGYGSRREIEKWIDAGRIKVNGQLATLGDRVTDKDKIQLDGKFLTPSVKLVTRVLVYHKPEGYLCTRDDPDGRHTIFEQLPNLRSGRWIQVGRLDINTSGLLLLTNNGELANRLMHPSYEIEREYAVRVFGEVTQDALDRLLEGVELEDGPAKFDQLNDAGGTGINHWYHVTLKEGRNREVRRLWEAVGLQISRLQRIRYGEIELPRRVTPGHFEDLSHTQINQLLKSVGLKEEAERPISGRKKTGKKRSAALKKYTSRKSSTKKHSVKKRRR